jgi:hypothetical protein
MDKREIRIFIDHLYHMSSTITFFKNEDLEDILNQVKTTYIGCFMNEENVPDIKFLTYTENEFKALKEAANNLYQLQYS